MLERLLLTVLRHRTSQYLSGMQTPKQLDLIEIDDLVSIGMAGKLESDPLVGLIGICRRGQSECAGDGAAVLAALDRQGWVVACPPPQAVLSSALNRCGGAQVGWPWARQVTRASTTSGSNCRSRRSFR